MSGQKIDSSALLAEIRKAWCEYNQIQGEWDYHLEEGGDTDLTRRDVHMAWEKLNNLITANANLHRTKMAGDNVEDSE